MSAVLVTSGAGSIGPALIRMLIRETDHAVVNIDKLTYAGNLESLPDIEGQRYQFHRLDICDGNGVGELLSATCRNAIVHRAAESHVGKGRSHV